MADLKERILRNTRRPRGAPADYIEHGSKEHADLLGIRPAEEADEITYRGFALIDPTQWGPFATEMFIKAQLMFKVNEFDTGAPKVPETASKMFVPVEMRAEVQGV